MSEKIDVKFKYVYNSSMSCRLTLKELLKEIIQLKSTYLYQWLDNDNIYDPNNYYKITNFKLKNGRLQSIELTEMENAIDE